MSDEHSRRALGCYGNEQIATPNLDHLAEGGTRFPNAYCTDPICVPSRASIATGRYPHKIETWDNGRPYTGATAQSWGHRLTDHGADVVTIGKLHYADSADPTGFPDQRVPLHVHNKVGNPTGLLRASRPPTTGGRDFILQAGPGETEYFRYDVDIADRAVRWLAHEALQSEQWALHVSFVSPHFPLVVPQRYFGRYADVDVELPVQRSDADWPRHPALDFHRRSQGNDVLSTTKRSAPRPAPTTASSRSSTSRWAASSTPRNGPDSSTTRWSFTRPTTGRCSARTGCGKRARCTRSPSVCR